MRLLIVDANADSCDLLASRLKPLGFVARCLTSPHDVADGDGFAAVLVDCDGFDAGARTMVQALRGGGLRQPLSILSSSADWRDRIEALDAGCDDVIAKPVRSEEVAARLRALIRRASGNDTDLIVHGDIRLDLRARCAWRGRQCLDLTRSEFRLLSMLMRRPDRTLDHVSIGQAIHPEKVGHSQNAIEVLVARLRRKVGHDRIRTVRGIGYRFDSSPAAEPAPAEACSLKCDCTTAMRLEELDPLCYI